jgi:DNA polymerase III gamma/tau subunit
MNTANYRGIDAVRAMLQRVGLKPVAGSEARVYILDECHQMTKDAQMLFLKALEDSANTQTYFMLCTTEPGKLEKTIVNRAIQFETKPLSSELMGQLIFDIHVEYMHDVTETDDSPTLPDAVIDAIVEKAEGSPRLALNILDKVIDLPQEKMITAIDSFAQQEQYGIDLAKLLINGCKWSDVQKLLKELQDDPESARRVVMGYANGVLVKSTSAKIQARAFVVLDAFKDPFYNMGKPGLTYATYLALNS